MCFCKSIGKKKKKHYNPKILATKILHLQENEYRQRHKLCKRAAVTVKNQAGRRYILRQELDAHKFIIFHCIKHKFESLGFPWGIEGGDSCILEIL